MTRENITATVLVSGIDRGQIISVLEFSDERRFQPGEPILDPLTQRMWRVQTYATGPAIEDLKETAVLIALEHDSPPAVNSKLIKIHF